MTYIEFFQKYSIGDIETKTHISPIVLNNIKDKRFDKFEKNKFYGFVKIIEREYSIKLDDLRADFKDYLEPSSDDENDKDDKEEEKVIEIKKDVNSDKKAYLLVFILLVLISGVIYYMKSEGKLSTNVAKKLVNKNSTNLILEHNETNVSKDKLFTKKVSKNRVFKIIPDKILWFKVHYLDNNSSKEYLTSHEVDLNISRNQYIKFGHGLFTMEFGDKNITPNIKHIVRYILIDGNISRTKRIKSYE